MNYANGISTLGLNQKTAGKNSDDPVAQVIRAAARTLGPVRALLYGETAKHLCRSIDIKVNVHSSTKPHTNCNKIGHDH